MENTAEKNIIPLNSNNTPKVEPAQTYFGMGTPETGSIEIDLITFRQKNQEAKFLTISMKNPNQKEDTSFSIDNEEAFNALKKFFEQLSWNA